MKIYSTVSAKCDVKCCVSSLFNKHLEVLNGVVFYWACHFMPKPERSKGTLLPIFVGCVIDIHPSVGLPYS